MPSCINFKNWKYLKRKTVHKNNPSILAIMSNYNKFPILFVVQRKIIVYKQLANSKISKIFRSISKLGKKIIILS